MTSSDQNIYFNNAISRMLLSVNHKALWIVSIIIVSSLLTACETKVTRTKIPEFSYLHLPKLNVLVSEIQVVQKTEPTFKEANIEHLFPMPISSAVRRWVNHRLVPEGNSKKVMRVIIEEAKATALNLKTNEGLKALFTNEQEVQIDANLHVKIEIIDETNSVAAYTWVRVTRSRTIPESSSIEERDKIYSDLTMVLMNDFNTTQEQKFRRFFSNFMP